MTPDDDALAPAVTAAPEKAACGVSDDGGLWTVALESGRRFLVDDLQAREVRNAMNEGRGAVTFEDVMSRPVTARVACIAAVWEWRGSEDEAES